MAWGAALAILAGSCGGGTGNGADGGASGLAGRTFLSESVTEQGRPRPLVAGTRVRLTLEEDGRLRASAGCNTLAGPASLGDGRVLVADLSMTEIGCDPELHAQDDWLARFLSAGPAYALDGDELRLEAGTTVVVLADREVADPDRPLEGTVWRLEGIVEGEVVRSAPAEVPTLLVFGYGRVSVGVEGCGPVSAELELEDSELRFVPLSPPDSGCTGDAGETLEAILAVLEGEVAYGIDADRLTLARPGGEGLVLRARE